jgi:glycerol uptake facilitator-like aquaporin
MKYLVEFICTLLFFSAQWATETIPIAFGVSSLISIVLGSYYGAGHFNPAVTLFLYFKKVTNGRDSAWLILAQISASLTVFLLTLLFEKDIYLPKTSIHGCVLEVLFVFMLILLVDQTSLSREFMFLIPVLISLAHMVLIAVTGCSLNPARFIFSLIYHTELNVRFLVDFLFFTFSPFILSFFGFLCQSHKIQNADIETNDDQ